MQLPSFDQAHMGCKAEGFEWKPHEANRREHRLTSESPGAAMWLLFATLSCVDAFQELLQDGVYCRIECSEALFSIQEYAFTRLKHLETTSTSCQAQ